MLAAPPVGTRAPRSKTPAHGVRRPAWCATRIGDEHTGRGPSAPGAAPVTTATPGARACCARRRRAICRGCGCSDGAALCGGVVVEAAAFFFTIELFHVLQQLEQVVQ